MFNHLKEFTSTEGYWSSTDCVEIAKEVINITKAQSLLEIGFNIGYSASMWIEAGISNLVIIDINNHRDTLPAIRATAQNYKDISKVSWWIGDSKSEEAYELDLPKIDMCFIDGEHSYNAALNDSWLGIHYGAKWLVYDDVIENHVNGISEVISYLERIKAIEVVKTYPMTWTEQGSVVLCRVLT
jgi:predicted O-methyltransferase YrrM